MIDVSNYIVAQVVLMSRELDRAEGELRGLLERLSEDELVSLTAVMWVGRESFAPEELAEALATARREATTPTADYLIGTPHLSDHLENGMEALGLSISEIEDDLLRGG
ncbi:MAG: DUF3775 domain-containing protein [Halocynthiibacter sp.]